MLPYKINQYKVLHKPTGVIRLVETHSRSSAIQHIAHETLEASIPSIREAIELSKAGIEIEVVPSKQREPKDTKTMPLPFSVELRNAILDATAPPTE